jgi:hypothetical protein
MPNDLQVEGALVIMRLHDATELCESPDGASIGANDHVAALQPRATRGIAEDVENEDA